MPDTRPAEDTVAIDVLELDQVMVRPVSTLLFASFVVAVSCTVWPTITFAVPGETVTDATGTGAVTRVRADVPLFPSLVAVMVTDPAPSALTRPDDDTVARLVFELDHVTVRPLSAAPFASCGVAVSCNVWPTVTVPVPGVTLTEVTGTTTAVTEMVAVPLLPSLVAVIVADPAAAAVTRPLDETLATPALEVVHEIGRPIRVAPLASRRVAVSCVVCPTVMLDVGGETSTDATGGTVTVTVAVPLFPSLVAVMVAEPAPAPVTTPVEETLAMPVLELDHDTARPARIVPFASFVVAVSCVA
jgi:hypothetical protein